MFLSLELLINYTQTLNMALTYVRDFPNEFSSPEHVARFTRDVLEYSPNLMWEEEDFREVVRVTNLKARMV